MAINKKGFRKITVGEVQYFWKVTPDQWMLRLFITRGDNAYCNLKSYFNQTETGPCTSMTKLTPMHVRAVIELALKQGWDPSLKGKDMLIEMPDL